MNRKSPPTGAQAREERLKAALKQNLGRRKAQARSRAQTDGVAQDGQKAGDNAPKEEE